MLNVEFFISLGYVTLISCLLTLLAMQLIKIIMKKRDVLNESVDENYKDQLLSRIGRICVVVIYTLIYFLDVYLNKKQLNFDLETFTSIGSGITLTMTLTKGVYTSLKQMSKKKNVYEKLKYAQETINELNEVILQNKSSSNQEVLEEINESLKTKWVLKNKGE